MMNKQDILRKIGNIINELNEQHQYLSGTSKINILELELFTANADFLIDHIEILKKINSHVPEIAAPAPEVVQEETPFYSPVAQQEDVVMEQIPEKAVEIVDLDVAEAEEPIQEQETSAALFKFDFEEPKEMAFDFERRVDVEEVFDRELTAEEQNLIDDKRKEFEVEEVIAVEEENENYDRVDEEEMGEEPFIMQQPQVIELPVVEKEEPVIEEILPTTQTVEKATEPEQPKVEKILSLNEIFSNKAQSAQTPSHQKPITDLKSSISLNDKMFFIKELFNGYNLAYSEAIEILNRFDSFEAADNFLMKNYAEKNNWAAKQQTVDRLYEILNRKFKS
ncbi:MAG: hypothetical protein EOO85_27190 [Pedobacter sp.]|nr:MAG: hypothetical protein EOO85_27190 [Pedobacter sp.]